MCFPLLTSDPSLTKSFISHLRLPFHYPLAYKLNPSPLTIHPPSYAKLSCSIEKKIHLRCHFKSQIHPHFHSVSIHPHSIIQSIEVLETFENTFIILDTSRELLGARFLVFTLFYAFFIFLIIKLVCFVELLHSLVFLKHYILGDTTKTHHFSNKIPS